MRVAALYDIHGNAPALQAVLAEAESERIDIFLIGGDVATGPLPRETLELLISLGRRAQYVLGNSDREAVDAFDRGHTDFRRYDDQVNRWAAFTAGQISRTHRDLLASFAPSLVLDIDGLGQTLFCHGSPRSDSENITLLTSDARLRGVIQDVAETVIVCGHTHQQFDRKIDDWRIVNAGSVGIPYEGRAGAYWAVLGPDVQLRRTEYDLELALQELAASGFPDVDEMLKESLLEPIDPGEVARIYEQMSLDDK
jgi:predicted phosphodiesterase